MRRILLVDDEAFITDSLARMLQREMGEELDVYKAYSAQEALSFLNKVSADLVVTDVHMPGMSGLELLQEIDRRWPACRVVFLSAWDTFEYIHDAMKYHAVRYVLKNEGDDVLLDAVRESIAELEQEEKSERLLAMAQAQVERYRPLSQQRFLQSFLNNAFDAYGDGRLREELRRLDIPLQPELPLLLLAALPDDRERYEEVPALNTILQEKLGSRVVCQLSISGPSFWLWLLQPRPGLETEKAVVIARDAIERVQNACREFWDLPLSFLFDPEPADWPSIHERFLQNKYLIEYRLADHPKMMLAESGSLLRSHPAAADLQASSYILLQDRLPLVLNSMNSGNRPMFCAQMEALLCPPEGCGIPQELEQAKIRSAIYTSFLQFISQHDLQREILLDESIMNFIRHPFENGPQAIIRAGERLIDHLPAGEKNKDDGFVKELDAYIEENLAGDLSLLALSEQVYLNPSYLSRRYKELTGKNISEVIAEKRLGKALHLLETSRYKVNEIALMVGFESPAHFSRVFKKQTGKTPQEYRLGLS